VAVKRLLVDADEAAHRELAIGEWLAGRSLGHVVPVLDYGLDPESDRYFIVMPRCDRSLQDELSKGSMPEGRAVEVALQIVKGLREVGEIVHRDLKPGNVLLHEGIWKIADFGIAAFVEKATSLRTLRRCLTHGYAAPEQWREERSTKATDVYALGCLIHALLDGRPPFMGETTEVQDAHLHKAPPALAKSIASPRLASLVTQMLRKAPQARPSLERCQKILEGIDQAQAPSGARALLGAVAAGIAQKEAEEEASHKAHETAAIAHRALGEEAKADLARIFQRLIDEIEALSDNVQRFERQITLGNGILNIEGINLVPFQNVGGTLGYSGWGVAAEASILVICNDKYRGIAYAWSCSLIFAERSPDEGFRWYELGFRTKETEDAPHMIPFSERDLDIALSRLGGKEMLALGPWPIDAEDEDQFIERWLWIFAKAAGGTLDRPSSLPLPDGFWR
jgi:eukaryotic-like serine/threonine-protein kinase